MARSRLSWQQQGQATAFKKGSHGNRTGLNDQASAVAWLAPGLPARLRMMAGRGAIRARRR